MKSNIKKNLFNAAKISTGCVISIIICTILNLKYSMSAGLLTVLSIQDTKRETLNTALKRLYAFFCAFIISIICFNLLGYTALSFGIYLFIFVNICIIFDWKSATVPISVLITHLISEQNTGILLIVNEFLLFLIGVGTGMIVNLHLKNNEKKMTECRTKLDNEIKNILERMSSRIIDDDKSDYNAECFRRIDSLMFEAQKTAHENRDNTLRYDKSYDIQYLKMRKKQCITLYEMYKSILQIKTVPEQAKIISDFLLKISAEYDEKNNVKNLIKELSVIFDKMKEQPMPKERSEFENRAVLYFFMLQMKKFLLLKYNFMTETNPDIVGNQKI